MGSGFEARPLSSGTDIPSHSRVMVVLSERRPCISVLYSPRRGAGGCQLHAPLICTSSVGMWPGTKTARPRETQTRSWPSVSLGETCQTCQLPGVEPEEGSGVSGHQRRYQSQQHCSASCVAIACNTVPECAQTTEAGGLAQ